MPPNDAEAARRRAELQWQQQTRPPAGQAGAPATARTAQQDERRAIDEKTARLRLLRLARDDAQSAETRASRGRAARMKASAAEQ